VPPLRSSASVSLRQQRISQLETDTAALSLASRSLWPEIEKHLRTLVSAPLFPEKAETLSANALEAVQAAQSLEADAFYSAFEARFRGSREAIMDRQSYYLPHLAEARAKVRAAMPPKPTALTGPHAAPFERLRSAQGVLDLGSGRGEWLELLRQKEVPAIGVELNQVFLAYSRQIGLEVIASDVIDLLKAAPSDSVAVVTGFHIIEHLPFPVLQEFIRQSFRILSPCGLAIFETPNPRNMQVGAHNFWSDPTHLRPAHPDFTHFLLENAGFTQVRLEYLTPYPPEFHVGQKDDSLAQRFNELFYGPQDFAVIGTKNG